MNIQNKIPNSQRIRGLSTSDIDELAQFQLNKNRRYTQLQAGQLKGNYAEVNLGDVQIFREDLSAGTLIEAAPASSFLPFAAILSNVDDFSFCGKKIATNNILQATGGIWDVCFKNRLTYVAAAFDRDSFSRNIEQLTCQEIPDNWLVSKACNTNPVALSQFSVGIDHILNMAHERPEVLATENSLRMLGDSLLSLIFKVLQLTTPGSTKLTSQSNRLLGVRRVIDYLHHYASDVPTIPELCKVANLSERHLQYGFKELLGVTPIRYLRLVRLNGVRRELMVAHPKKNRIVDIALSWGFIELGRFAGDYRKLFQELPSVTLNKEF